MNERMSRGYYRILNFGHRRGLEDLVKNVEDGDNQYGRVGQVRRDRLAIYFGKGFLVTNR